MWFGLFLIFVAIPLLELALLIKVGQWIGFWPTVAIIFVTAAAGVMVMQSHGLRTMQRAMATLQEGGMPVRPVVDGTFVMFAGLLLISPGLMTDVAGLLLLIPPIRRVVSQWSMQRLLASGRVRTWTAETWTAESGTAEFGTTESGNRQTGSTDAGRSAERRPDREPPANDQSTGEPVTKRWNTKARSAGQQRSDAGPVIDGEFERIDEKPVDQRQPKGKNP
jgi:UPF0716 family protein affecting phage T7 exclusion